MIKPQYLLGLLCAGALGSFAPEASAQCVVADVSIQAAIHGGNKPAEQVNDVAVDAEGPCVGNTSVSTNRQIQVGGTGEVRQTRQSRHQLRGSGQATGAVSGPTVTVPVNVQVDVYNPAERLRR
ncbi:hypothetical protein IQ265_13850 [Nodosilinea sp. LEGE 06152]|uniref:hypothetical protein n=1 Tax=Nodosilinea sp. LEGE 06152 TaxID=2777966 RepID=UPI00187F6A63|nr:hypothetical protein [Nodosilinea sp. LEGE 06152]MBE9157900.1 hypothetical protein [Nodosilinea sp. LEGE 06152]